MIFTAVSSPSIFTSYSFEPESEKCAKHVYCKQLDFSNRNHKETFFSLYLGCFYLTFWRMIIWVQGSYFDQF